MSLGPSLASYRGMSVGRNSFILFTVLVASTGQNAWSASIEVIQQKSKALAEKTEHESTLAHTRWNHAKELLGKYYKKSVVKTGEEIAVLDEFLRDWTKHSLKEQWKKSAPLITKTIIQESDRYHFDPVFLMAVIQNESSFDPTVRGSFGEIGLMQLTPQTAEWITKKYSLPWRGKESLKDPVTNIRIGSAYLAYLREKFGNQSQLYLAAYNMGSTNVNRALAKQIWPKDYATRVIHRYLGFYTHLRDEFKKSLN